MSISLGARSRIALKFSVANMAIVCVEKGLNKDTALTKDLRAKQTNSLNSNFSYCFEITICFVSSYNDKFDKELPEQRLLLAVSWSNFL